MIAEAFSKANPSADPAALLPQLLLLLLPKVLHHGARWFRQRSDLCDLFRYGFDVGTAGLPHIMMRFFTVPNAKEARKSVFWATTWIGYFYILTFIIGFGAITFVLTNPEFLDAKARSKAVVTWLRFTWPTPLVATSSWAFILP